MISPDAAAPAPLGGSSRRELLTIVLTDIAGSTELKERLGDEAGLALIEQHDALLRELLLDFPQAKEIGVLGDSFTLTFPKPSDAVVFALRLQEKLRAQAAVLASIGIHVGEVLVHQDTAGARPLAGLQIDACARLTALGRGGQILLTRFAFDAARQALRDSPVAAPLEWLDHGVYQFKGVEELVEVCEVGERGKAPLSLPPNHEKAHRVASPNGEAVFGWRPAAGQKVPRTSWKLTRSLGAGGFGEVWLGEHLVLHDRRVFKFCFNTESVRSLKREVTLFRILREHVGEHPGIVKVHDVFFDEPPYYIGMDYVEGDALPGWAAAKGGLAAVPLEARLELIAQVADALQAAHDAGVIHRDVKPANILIETAPGEVPRAKLSDFGIGQTVSADGFGGVTQLGFTHTMMLPSSGTGTPLYMAPELLEGASATTRSDIYSLGVVLFQMIAGSFSRPLTAELTEEITDPLLRDDLRGCLARDQQRRYAGAGQLAERLRALPARRAAAEEEKAQLARAERRAYRRGVARTALVGGGVLALVAVLAFSAWRSAVAEGRERTRAEGLLVRERKQNAESFLSDGGLAEGLAYLASLVRRNPQDRVSAERLLHVLTDGAFPRPVGTQIETDGVPTALAFSPDGALLATLTADRLQLWNSKTGERHGQPVQPGGKSLAFSPDGSAIVLAGADARLVRLRPELAVQALRVESESHNAHGLSLCAISADGLRVATSHKGPRVLLWNPHDGSSSGELIHPSDVTALTFSSDGQQLAVACHGGVHVWEVGSQAKVHELGGVGRAETLAWSGDGARLACGALDGTLLLWDAATGARIRPELRHEQQITSVIFSPDSGTLLATSNDGAMRLYDTLSGEQRGAFPSSENFIYGAEFSADGKRIVTRNGDASACVWDVRERRQACAAIRPGAFAPYARFSPDGGSVATFCSNGTAQLWDVRGNSAQPLRLPMPRVMHAAWAADSVCAIATDSGARPWMWSPGGNALADPAPLPRVAASPRSVSRDGRFVAWMTADGRAAWSEGWSPETLVELPVKAHQIDIANGGRYAVIAKADQAQVYDLASSQPVGAAARHRGKITAVGFSPSGRLFATASYDNSARIWNAATGDPLGRPLAHGHVVHTVAFNSDETRLVTTSYGPAATFWRVADGTRDGDITVRADTVENATFSPVDPRRVLLLTKTGVRLWDAAEHLPLSPPLTHHGRARDAVFSPDGRRVLIVPEERDALLVRDAAAIDAPPPPWLSAWAEAAGGQRLNAAGLLEQLSFAERRALEPAVPGSGDHSPFAVALRWAQSAPRDRMLAPGWEVSAAQAEAAGKQRGFPPRPGEATPAQLDLTPHYNVRLDQSPVPGDVENDFSALPAGCHEFARTRFDVRGLVQLGTRAVLKEYPREAREIAVEQPCARLHLLLAAALVKAPAGEELLRVIVRYGDGTTAEAPLVNGHDLADWWSQTDAPFPIVGWRGTNPFAARKGAEISLFKATWQNPRPGVPIRSLDLQTTDAKAAPFIAAITAE